MTQVIRTQWDGCYKIVQDVWGTHLQKTYDPEGLNLTPEELETFELSPDYVKIPSNLFNQIVSLFSSFSIEVQVVLIRRIDDISVWDALVPKQSNTGGSVSADKKLMISLTTGAEYVAVPDGWVESGSVH